MVDVVTPPTPPTPPPSATSEKGVLVKKADGTTVRMSLSELRSMKKKKAPAKSKTASSPATSAASRKDSSRAAPKAVQSATSSKDNPRVVPKAAAPPPPQPDLAEARRLMEQAKAQKAKAGAAKQKKGGRSAKKKQDKAVRTTLGLSQQKSVRTGRDLSQQQPGVRTAPDLSQQPPKPKKKSAPKTKPAPRKVTLERSPQPKPAKQKVRAARELPQKQSATTAPPTGLAAGIAKRVAAKKQSQQKAASAAIPPLPASAAWEDTDHKSLLDDEFHGDDMHAANDARRQALAKVSPVKDIFVDEAMAKVSNDKATAAHTRVPLPPPAPQVPHQQIPQSPKPTARRPVIHDVRPAAGAAKQSVGPVEEMARMTVTDFRRLAPSAQAAGSKMREKFDLMKDDSFLVFMEGRDAWEKSPLYTQYQDLLSAALTAHKPLTEAMQMDTSQERLKMDEFQAIVGLQKYIHA